MDSVSPLLRKISTSRGVLSLRCDPKAFEPSPRPVVIGLTGLFDGVESLAGLHEVLGVYGDGCVIRLHEAEMSGDWTIEAVAAALDEVILTLFGDRPVVLLGISIGATICLAARAPAIRRIVAVEPIFRPERLWPIHGPVRAALRQMDPGSRQRACWRDLFGITEQTLEPRDYRGLIETLASPADVVLGGVPLMPPRAVDAFPSLVDVPERQQLSASPRVRLHFAPGVGHIVQSKAERLTIDVVLEACRRAAARRPYAASDLDEALLEATPITAARVLHWGDQGEAFASAFLARNPQARVEALGEHLEAAKDLRADVVAASRTPDAATLKALAARLGPGGHMVMRWTLDTAPANTPLLSAAGLDDPTELEPGVIRLKRLADPATPRLRVDTLAYAPLLMDIRARLPAQMLRSLPGLALAYHTKSFVPPRPGRDVPKVIVAQRPGHLGAETWRNSLADFVRDGWMVVIEVDDHPALASQVKGQAPDPMGLTPYGYAHALQTSTAPLVDLFRTALPDVALFPNAAFELLPFPKGKRPRRVFYGGVLRGEFPVQVARSLAPAVAAFPDLEFLVVGDKAVFEALPTPNKSFHPYLSYEAYLAEMSRCAISLSPVVEAPMWETKSDAKFLDASRAGVLTIGSPITYGGVIEHGVNGLLAADLEAWAPALIEALEDPQAQARMARAAWEYVRRERMFVHQAQARVDWYWDLWARREALDKALRERLPTLQASPAAPARAAAPTPATAPPAAAPPPRKPLKGPAYRQFVWDVVRLKKARSYLEVGVRDAVTLAEVACPSIGVDPNFVIDRNPVGKKGVLHLYQMTSDEFFRDHDPRAIFGAPVDVAFLDGMHLFEYLLRDFMNTERLCEPNSVILLDDCLPINIEMTERTPRPELRKDKAIARWWTGDVWKVVSILREFRLDLRIVPVDVIPTGSIAITNLDPSSTILRERYEEIVARFEAEAFTPQSFDDYWATNAPRPAMEFTAAFDHFLNGR